MGGAGTGVAVDSDNSEYSEDAPQYAKNSIMVCTGANACGKVVVEAFSVCGR